VLRLDNSINKTSIFDVMTIREDFPILQTEVHGKPLIYLDNAATTQKPKAVIDTLIDYFSNYNSNIHRGVYLLSQKATDAYEQARYTVKNFINAKRFQEIIFTRGTTEAINLVARSWAFNNLNEGDEIIVSNMEHHSNIVPWQMICEEKKANLKVIPIDDTGSIIYDEFLKMLNVKVKLVSIVHISNSLGTINPVENIIKASHKHNIPVMLDAAQSIQHISIDVQSLDCDFLAFSGHKLYGPTGIGVLYAKEKFLNNMPPYQGGGDMIRTVSFEKTTYNELPYKFEAGTQNIADAIALASAIKYIERIGFNAIEKYEAELLDYAHNVLSEIKELKIIGTAPKKASVVSFVLDGIHPHDVGTMLDVDGIAVRTGQHCTEPLMKRFGIPATTRASFSFYNTKSEVDKLAESIWKVIKMFA